MTIELFRKVMARTIVLLEETLSRDQLVSLAGAFTTICWEFPDVAWSAWLRLGLDPPGIRLEPEPAAGACLTVIINSTALHSAAMGETSLGREFVCGRLQVRGLNPLLLAKFVRLVEPLLNSYRAAAEELHAEVA